MEKIIELSGVYAGYEATAVLEDVTLDIYKNDFIGIIGPNGGGKTTLLKILLGLVPVRQGSVKIFGQPPEKARTHCGYVPQVSRFDWDFPMKVKDVVLSGRLKFKSGGGLFYTRCDRKKADEVLEKLEIDHLKNTHIEKLSGGQRKRVFIARALVTEPDILLLDEPASELDTQIEKSLYELLETINKEKTILLVSHDIGVISTHINKVCCLNRKLHYHDSGKITSDMLSEAYHCPVELIAHGVPHRVFEEH